MTQLRKAVLTGCLRYRQCSSTNSAHKNWATNDRTVPPLSNQSSGRVLSNATRDGHPGEIPSRAQEVIRYWTIAQIR
jgi:hypothetical protein